MSRPDEPRPDEPRADRPAAGDPRRDGTWPGDGAVSAVLDGTATAAEQDLVASQPELRARLEAFRIVRDGLRPTPGDAERLGGGAGERIAAALRAWDPPHALDDGSVPDRVVVAAPDGAERGRARGLAWLGAAAAVVLVAGIGVVVARSGSDEGTDRASTEQAGSVPPAAIGQDAGSRDATGGGGSDPTTTAGAATPSELSEAESSRAAATGSFLGSFGSRADLDRAALAAASAAAASGTPSACATALAGPGAVAVGTALLGGRDVVVGVTAASSVVVLDAADCTPVA